MSRFYLLDPTIRTLTGHFYQYAVHVLDAARRAGFAPVLATNRALAIPDVPFEVHPVFRYSYQLDRHDIPGLAAAGRLVETARRLVARVAGPRPGAAGAASAPGPPAEHGAAFRLAVRLVTRLKVAQLARDLAALFRRRPPAPGDVVLLPSAEEIDTLGLDRFLSSAAAPAGVGWHLLYHLPLFRGREPGFPGQRPNLVRGAGRFAAAVRRLRRRGVRFHTDTDELARQYERVAGPPFTVMPIPHTAPVPAPRTPTDPLRVCYVGDARSEKGFQHLPHMVDALWDDLVEPGRVAFTFQANESFLRDDPPVAAARDRLVGRPADRVELIRRPLPPADYQALLHRCDVALMPYDAEAYYARSSGVMTEVLAVGAPVVVSAGSWLARQFAAPVRDHIAGVRDRTPPLATVGFTSSPAAADKLADGPLLFEGAVPARARTLAGAFTVARTGPGVFVKARIEWSDASGARVGRRHALVSAESAAGTEWFMVPVPPHADRVRLAVWDLDTGRAPERTVGRLEFRGTRGAPEPLASVGLTCSDPEDLPDLVREVVAHYPHYRRTAGAFAADFFRFHNADRYLRELLPAASPQAVRPDRPVSRAE
jgi:hypothetical protein